MRRASSGFGILLAGILGGAPALAGATFELRDLYRDIRMKAMGGAGIALPLEDRDAVQGVFTNPAQMAGNENLTLHYVNGDVSASWDTYTSLGDVQEAFQDFTIDKLNVLMGKNSYANAQYVGAITGPNFGVAALVDGQAGFYAQNPSYPEYTVGYQSTNGVQGAWGTTIDLGGPRPRRPRRGSRSAPPSSAPASELRVGLGGKVFWRKGGYKDVPLATLMTANADTLKALMGNYEIGYGIDGGAQFIRQVSDRFSFSFAGSYQNIGDMNFRGSVADTQPGNLTAGLGMTWQLQGLTSFSLAYDHAYLNESIDWRKRQHLGFEWTLPGIAVFGGIHQTYLSYGASFDAWILRVTAASYAEELGGGAYQAGDRRYLLRLAMRFVF